MWDICTAIISAYKKGHKEVVQSVKLSCQEIILDARDFCMLALMDTKMYLGSSIGLGTFRPKGSNPYNISILRYIQTIYALRNMHMRYINRYTYHNISSVD